ncbi:hypothetical protein P7C70_g2773, partial [Phenoliferia sp. Uapishka_3]
MPAQLTPVLPPADLFLPSVTSQAGNSRIASRRFTFSPWLSHHEAHNADYDFFHFHSATNGPPPTAQTPSQWDQTFLANPQFKHWAQQQLAAVPLRPGQKLVDYVRERISLQNQRVQARAGPLPTPTPTPEPQSQQPPQQSSASVQQAAIRAEQERERQRLQFQQNQLLQAQRQQQQQLAPHDLSSSAYSPYNPSIQPQPRNQMELDDVFDINGYPADTEPTASASASGSSSSSSSYTFNSASSSAPTSSIYNFSSQQPSYSSSTSFSQPPISHSLYPSSSTGQSSGIDPSLVLGAPPSSSSSNNQYSSLELQRQELAQQQALNNLQGGGSGQGFAPGSTFSRETNASLGRGPIRSGSPSGPFSNPRSISESPRVSPEPPSAPTA